jgi:hypothetical protein
MWITGLDTNSKIDRLPLLEEYGLAIAFRMSTLTLVASVALLAMKILPKSCSDLFLAENSFWIFIAYSLLLSLTSVIWNDSQIFAAQG